MKIKRPLLSGVLLLLTLLSPARGDYAAWQHSGSLFILTTPDGANLPATAAEENFPVLVRLHKDFFDFTQAKPAGEDLRVSNAGGDPLPFEIEEWDAGKGVASIWVRIPSIKGNARQEIKLHWGNPAAASESSGKNVFNAASGYLGVFHMNGPVKDETGNLQTKDTGTTEAQGMIGAARHFPGGHGIFLGEMITTLPKGSSPNTTEVWFRPEVANGRVLGWGNEAQQGKIVMNYRSPPHISMDCYFSNADVHGKTPAPRGEWVHVLHTYTKGQSLLYLNGVLDGTTKSTSSPLNIKSPARMWIGGWYNDYDFAGDIDEVRVSNVVRSADWAKLEYENQKPLQTLTGPLVQPGEALSVSPAQLTVTEGQSAAVAAKAGGAQKLYWILKREGMETVVATDRLNYTFEAGRVSGDQAATLQLKAVYANETKTIDVPVTVKESIPDPVFTLKAPATWDGRSTIVVTPEISNIDQIGPRNLTYQWKVADFAVTKEVFTPEVRGMQKGGPPSDPATVLTPIGKLTLTRAQNSGTLKVTATLSNGGKPISQTVQIAVTEPASDPWVQRTPGKDEKPLENQFYARDDKNEGTLNYNGTLTDAADAVFIKVTADDKPYKTETAKVAADKSYALSVKLKPGMVKYKAEFGTKTGDKETLLNTVNNIVCGDAYLIDGQSNAVSTDWGKEEYVFTSPWIRTFGSTEGGAQGARLRQWENAVARGNGGKFNIGCWPMELARRLVEDQKIPICIINGAVGGTRIDQHQRSIADPEDVSTIYGRLLWRVRQAGLTHGIRAVFWHQGENDQGADGPTGGFGYEHYREFFLDMAAAWKQDYPNIQHYYLFQIWPKSCAMGINGSDNRLREVQRQLPTAFSKMNIMSTLGIAPPGGCHFPPAGYAEIARHICPLVERDNYGKAFTTSITPPKLKLARFTNRSRDEVVMEFDQPVKWDKSLAGQFYLDGQSGKIASGEASGNRLTLKLSAPSTAQNLTYLDSKSWNQATLLRGENGIAALTFCEVPIAGPAADP